jgi:hypothetical protein
MSEGAPLVLCQLRRGRRDGLGRGRLPARGLGPRRWPRTLPLPVVARHAGAAGHDPAREPQALGPAYDTTGGLTCVDGIDGPNATCSYGAVHEGSGNGYVQITEPGFGGRTITFENGAPVYFDQSQADGDVTMDVARLGDIWSLQIGTRRFEVPVALFEAHPDVVTPHRPAAGARRRCRTRATRLSQAPSSTPRGRDRLHPRSPTPPRPPARPVSSARATAAVSSPCSGRTPAAA